MPGLSNSSDRPYFSERLLEHLEDNFYREGLANFTYQQFADTGYDAIFYANV
jgi:hypothetical protein